MTWRAPYFDMRSGLWIPTVLTWDRETGFFARVEGPRGFETWREAEEAAGFSTRRYAAVTDQTLRAAAEAVSGSESLRDRPAVPVSR